MRLIDADALHEFVEKEFPNGTPYEWAWALTVVDHAPTIDAVEVVRCKDCRHWDCYGGDDAHKGDCMELVGLDSCVYENDFCSYGERKSE